jgi:hypothetical protein
MITDFDVYCAYRKAQAKSKNRPYRIPKDWNKQRNEKMSEQNLKWLDESVIHFNTRFCNIDIDEYMSCGFELLKTFTYKNFLDSRIIELYIQKDKIKKRKLLSTKKDIVRSLSTVKQYMINSPQKDGYSSLQLFCKLKNGEQRVIVDEYNKNNIDPALFVYCMSKKYFELTDFERSIIPYIRENYRTILRSLNDLIDFIEEKERELTNVLRS